MSIQNNEITSLILDNATLSLGSFDAIVAETTHITDASLVGLTFSDSNPAELDTLLGISSLNNVWVDQALFDLYADEFTAFDAIVGNTLTVILEGDCDKDGVFSAADLACVKSENSRDVVLASLNTLPGDLDGDGDVAFDDFLILASDFDQDLPSSSDGNIDLAGGVDFADFLIMSSNFGKAPSEVSAVPEPLVEFLQNRR